MESSNKLKKIEIEIYEENEVDFWLAYSNLFENEIYKQNLLNSIPNYQTKHSAVIDNLITLFLNGSRDGIKSFWRFFKKASKHNNSNFYHDLIGDSIIDFSKKDISLDLNVLFGGFQMLKVLAKDLTLNTNLVFSILSNRIYHLLKYNIDEPISNSISERLNSYIYSEVLKKFIKNDISKKEIFDELQDYFDFAKGLNNSNNTIKYRNNLIEFFYSKLKKQYNFNDHSIYIIIGFILSQIGILDNFECYDDKDKRITYREYLKSSVNNFMNKFISKEKLDTSFTGELENILHFHLSAEQKNHLLKVKRFENKLLCKV